MEEFENINPGKTETAGSANENNACPGEATAMGANGNNNCPGEATAMGANGNNNCPGEAPAMGANGNNNCPGEAPAGGSLFEEKSFVPENEPGAAPYAPPQQFPAYNNNPVSYNGQSADPNGLYRQMYGRPAYEYERSNNTGNGAFTGNVPPPPPPPPPDGIPRYAENASLPGGGYAAGGYNYYRPGSMVSSVSDVPVKNMKKSSKGWIIVFIILCAALLSAVMIMLAVSHKNGASPDGASKTPVSPSSESSGDKVTVNISIAPRPAANEEYYQDKERGLFTPAGAAQQVLPSIVNLYGYTSTTIMPYNEASGVIISEDGYIITNAHAVENIKRFKAKLNDEREFEATLVGMDTMTDLAVLKIEAPDLTPAVIGDSDQMIQGEQVIAIGNAGGFNDTVTVGNVSYVNREIKSYTGYNIKCIQTDAALNFGNSGGALVNLYGQVVGIVVSKYSSTGSENIGFAIASNFAVPVIEDIIANGYVSNRGRIGITYRFIDPESASVLGVKPGLLVAEIDPDCDIANSGLRPDDIITELNGVPVITENVISEFKMGVRAGDEVKAKVYRKTIDNIESEFEITFKLDMQIS